MRTATTCCWKGSTTGWTICGPRWALCCSRGCGTTRPSSQSSTPCPRRSGEAPGPGRHHLREECHRPMELNDAFYRIFRQHLLLILFTVAVCATGAAVLGLGEKPAYTASTRLVLDTQ